MKKKRKNIIIPNFRKKKRKNPGAINNTLTTAQSAAWDKRGEKERGREMGNGEGGEEKERGYGKGVGRWRGRGELGRERGGGEEEIEIGE